MPPGDAVMNGGLCLDDETLALLLDGFLDEREDADVRAHLDQCEACRQLFAEAARSANTAPGGSARRAKAIKPMTLEPGVVVAGKYRILRRIGEGGMGYVLAARHVALDGMVALKVMRPEVLNDTDAVRRFAREGKAAAALKSEHAVRIFDVGRLETGTPYIVMEHLEGSDLATILEKNGPLPIPTAIDHLLQVCEAVEEAHKLGIIHRDLKPHNMFLTRGVTGEPCMKVLDFGLAKASALTDGETSMTGTNVMLGSPFFMSPEQIHSTRDVDHRTDIWSLGASLYNIVTGSPPFVAPNVHLVCARILTEDFPPVQKRRPDAPAELDSLLRCCMSRSVEARFSKVSELVRALRLLRRSMRDSHPDAPSMNTSDIEILSDRTMDSTATTLVRASANPPPPTSTPHLSDDTTIPNPLSFRKTDPMPPAVVVAPVPAPVPATVPMPTQRAPRLDSSERRAVAGTRSAIVLGVLAAMALVASFIALRARARSVETKEPTITASAPVPPALPVTVTVPLPVPESTASAAAVGETPSATSSTSTSTSTSAKRPSTKRGAKGHSDPDPYDHP